MILNRQSADSGAHAPLHIENEKRDCCLNYRYSDKKRKKIRWQRIFPTILLVIIASAVLLKAVTVWCTETSRPRTGKSIFIKGLYSIRSAALLLCNNAGENAYCNKEKIQ